MPTSTTDGHLLPTPAEWTCHDDCSGKRPARLSARTGPKAVGTR